MPKGGNKTGRNGPRFVQIFHWIMDTEAWTTMPSGAKMLYIELRRRFTGSNNGEIFLSHRDAAKTLGVHRNSIGPWFKILQERGFIEMTRGPHLDIHQHVTDTIIAQMEAGTPPWRKPWTGGGGAAALPLRHNGEPYRGVNILMLWASAEISGFTSERWMTFKQAIDLGGSVIKGSKCARSVFYGTFEKDDSQTEHVTEGAKGKSRIPFAKCNNVFNADQIEGLPDAFYTLPEPARDLGTRADPELEAFFAKTGADIVTTTDPRAYYRPSTDQVHMPPIATFFEAARYYGVLGHELPSRRETSCPRLITCECSDRLSW